MKVILLEEVKGLGKAGDIKEVPNGYGLNFLLPKGLADLATPVVIKEAQKRIAKRVKEAESLVADLRMRATAVDGRTVSLSVKSENGKLFGSIGAEEIATALQSMNVDIEAKNIVLEHPLKKIGVFPVQANFGHDITARFEVSLETA
ncbi:MAG: 50S ribosomal protein L9 [Candidatus Moranbacteria bacterium]|nr:50S ribosomal protein L9 [Candidatus Moranbacteria bacterium]